MKKNEFVQATKKQLVNRRDALRRALAGDISMLRAPHEGAVGDEIDAAIATEQAELRSQMASFESRELAQIENALDNIRRGQYGRCQHCSKPISPLRLKALPYATECIECARDGERRGALADRSSPVNRIASLPGEHSEALGNEAYEEIG